MSRRFGDIRQIAFVVPDLEVALAEWTDVLGIGPFFVMRDVVPADFRYRGEASPAPRLSIALGNSGDLQIEIIEQHDAQPSAYREFLDAGGNGFQHMSSWLTPAEYDESRARLVSSGAEIVHEGTVPSVNVRFAYFATARSSTPLYEIADVMQPGVIEAMQGLAVAAREWDGNDPVRDIG